MRLGYRQLERSVMFKHLTLRDRVIIQYEIENNSKSTLKTISDKLGCDSSSLYREIIRNRISWGSRALYFNKSKSSLDCHRLKQFPYTCNRCHLHHRCTKKIYTYDALHADLHSKEIRVQTRSKPKLSSNQMKELDQKVSYRLKRGQSIQHIVATDSSLEVSSSTLRRYVNKGYLQARNIDLAMTVQRKVKSSYQRQPRNQIDIKLLVNRTFQDYQDYISTQPRVTLQLDFMIGKSRDKVALLTLYEPQSKLQWGVLINRNALNVNQVIKELITKLEQHHHYRFFDCILCDNGQEFRQLPQLEVSPEGELLTKIFYCDPYASYQKGGCERNHALIRRMIKKGESMSLYSQQTIDNIFSNLNSHKRQSLGNHSPFEMFKKIFGFCITEILSLQIIKPKDIILK